MDKTVIMTVAGATNCRIDYNALTRKVDVDMCNLFEEIAKEGKAEGIKQSLVLFQNLFAAGRTDDAQKAASDKAFREELLKEFGLE